MLRILIGFAAKGRCFNRFFVRKRVQVILHSPFSILNSQFKSPLALTLNQTSTFLQRSPPANFFKNWTKHQKNTRPVI